MELAERKFADVFKKIKFSNNIERELGDANVDFIGVRRSIGEIKINMNLKRIANENIVIDFEKQLKTAIPAINKVYLNIRYAMDNMSPNEILSMYWGNILQSIKNESPICYKILERANWSIQDETVVVKVNGNSRFMLTQRGVDKKIQQMLGSGFGLQLRVDFRQDKNSGENKDYEAKKADKERAIIAEAMSGMVITDSRPREESRSNDNSKFGNKGGGRRALKLSPEIEGEIFQLSQDIVKDDEIIVCGEIFELEKRETKSGKLLITFDITDTFNSVTVKLFINPEKFTDEHKNLLKKGSNIVVKGRVQFDDFSKELNIMAMEIAKGEKIVSSKRADNEKVKRVELHLHTQMSQMDAIHTAKQYINQALEWGHTAIAITDHGVVQAFPEAMSASRGKPIKVIYGVEAYLIDDLGAVVQCERGQTLDDTFTVFDIETTGLSKEQNKIIEIGAVRIENGVITEKFSSFVDPEESIPEQITKIGRAHV